MFYFCRAIQALAEKGEQIYFDPTDTPISALGEAIVLSCSLAPGLKSF
jgi:hypothetical protein